MKKELSNLSRLLIIVVLAAGNISFGQQLMTPRSDSLGHWKFEQQHISGSTVLDLSANGYDGTIIGTVNLNAGPEALILNGSNNYVTLADGPLPSRDVTLKAWVRVDRPVNWAGIVNYIQDNGSIEHGWILGQNGGSFLFGLSTGRLTYLSANTLFEMDEWYHVAGTYNGSQMRIYVNGESAGSSGARSGNISYLPSWYRIGSYKDDNETYMWDGMIAEVAVYGRALSAAEIRSNFDARKEEFEYYETIELSAGPYVRFYDRDEVTVYWKTEIAVPSVIEYGIKPYLSQTVSDALAKMDHSLTITDIRPETEYIYRILLDGIPSETYDFYSAFNYGPDPIPDGDCPYPADSLTPVYEQAAEYIIKISGITKGVCIDYGCGQGRLAYEIAKRSNLNIIGFEENSADVEAARNYLDQAGIYGNRVTVFNASLASLDCRNYSANLIVSDKMVAEGICPGLASEMFRVLRPDGGVAVLGQPSGTLTEAALESWLMGLSYTVDQTQGLWAIVERGTLDGAGSWTHLYADPTNTANSGDTRLKNNMKLLWYGDPGPRYILDRHNRSMPSLYNKGIIITPGLNRLMAYDAYNGSRYWDMIIPETARAAILRDCGWLATIGDYVYVAHKGDCIGLELESGVPAIHLQTPQLAGEKRNWGYLAVEDDNVFGSGQKDGASLIGHSRAHIDQAYYDHQAIATSDYLFCLDRYTGTEKWIYERAGRSAIINPSIVVGSDYIYFIESHSSTAVNDSDGRVRASVLMSGSNEYFVKLDKNTGAEVASRQFDLPFEHVVYLLYAADNDLVIAAGTHNDPGCRYEHFAFNGSDLSLAWSSDYYTGSVNTDHGEQDQHPCIIGATMYGRYYKVDLSNGNTTGFGLARSNCGTQSACATHLFGRSGNPYMYKLPGGSPIKMTNETRPGCWINMIPAGGLLVIPEASSGCTCDYSIQTSMAFMPLSVR
ncbi:MAG: LamG-like jellyroll fold domain-containing protein [Planctomycetota bacterium]|jgi:SAM-dependent methyltransferase